MTLNITKICQTKALFTPKLFLDNSMDLAIYTNEGTYMFNILDHGTSQNPSPVSVIPQHEI